LGRAFGTRFFYCTAFHKKELKQSLNPSRKESFKFQISGFRSHTLKLKNIEKQKTLHFHEGFSKRTCLPVGRGGGSTHSNGDTPNL
jgi:hypothetical protein